MSVRTLAAGAAFAMAATTQSASADACALIATPRAAGVSIDVAHVAAMREGRRTIASIALEYVGRPTNLALVVPVPASVPKDGVRTIPRAMIDRLELLTAPRAVELWERDPCSVKEADGEAEAIPDVAPPRAPSLRTREVPNRRDAYAVAMLDARDPDAIAAWLGAHDLAMSDPAMAELRAYAARGFHFVVATLDASAARTHAGRVELPALRLHYDADRFTLPTRVLAASSPEGVELFVYALGRHARYVAATFPNAIVASESEVADAARPRFATAFAALFDRARKDDPRTFVTEHAKDAEACATCTATPLDPDELLALGADTLAAAPGERDRPTFGAGFVLTRMHAHLDADGARDDLVMRAADPIDFEARYVARTPWQAPIRCANPVRGAWTLGKHAVVAATGIAYVPRGERPESADAGARASANEGAGGGAAAAARGCAMGRARTGDGALILLAMAIAALRRRR